MTGRRRLGFFFVAAGVLVLGASGVVWRMHAPDIGRMRADTALLEDSLTRVHGRLTHESILSRGLEASNPPDTVARYGGGKMLQLGNEYNKAIKRYEMQERDIKLEMASLRRDAEKEHQDARSQTLPVAGAGAALLLAGIILSAIPGRRVGA
jgi:hypothetical protein